MKYVIKKIKLYEKKYQIEDSENPGKFKYKIDLIFKPEILITDNSKEQLNIEQFENDIYILKDNNTIIYYEVLYKFEDDIVLNEILKLNENQFEALKQIDIDETFDLDSEEELYNILLSEYSNEYFNTLEEFIKIKDLIN